MFKSDAIDIDKVTKAIAAFEDTLVTPNSRFDKWLKGDKKALSADEKAGYKLFKDSGCVACHNGPAEGRVGVTGKDADRFNFKAPTLRNVEMTYPDFHDGAADTLPEAVDTMARVQLGKKFSREKNAQIVAFLKSLTGDQPKFQMPTLPPSSDSTPRPKPFEK